MPQKAAIDAPKILFRPYNETDVPFIMSSWLKSLKQSLPWRVMRKTTYFHLMQKRLTKVLNRSGAIIACDPTDPSIIIGWMCAEFIDLGHDAEPVMHYVYVKQKFRRFGIYRQFHALMAGTGATEKVPWSTHVRLRYVTSDTGFDTILPGGDGHTQHFGKAAIMVIQYNDAERSLPRTEYNPFLLDDIDSQNTIPCAHKTVI